MVEREQVRRHNGDEAVAAEDATREPSSLMTSDSETAKAEAEFERVMEIGREVMKDHHAVLAALAK